MLRVILLGAALTVGACASAAPPFDVYGSPGDLEQLAGKWAGEYVGDRDHVRRGSIAFDLAQGDDHAHGTVLMVPQGASGMYRRFEPGREGEAGPGRASAEAPVSLLTIRFAWVSAGVVKGVLDSYWDPDRATAAITTFTGSADGKRMAGTFVTEYANRAPATTGTWAVRRQ